MGWLEENSIAVEKPSNENWLEEGSVSTELSKPTFLSEAALPSERVYLSKKPTGLYDQLSRLDGVFSGEQKIEDLLPFDQRYQVGTIIDKSDKPKDEREKLANTLYFSTVLDQDPELLDPNLFNLIQHSHFNPSHATSEQRGFFANVAESFRRGDEQIVSDVAIYSARFEGLGNTKEAIKISKKLQQESALDPIEGNFLSELIYGSANVLPGMVRGYWDAVPETFVGMVEGAGIGFVAGVAFPTIGEEPITAATGAVIGAKTGLTVGSMHFWYKQGTGSFYTAMIEQGYDEEVSANIASIAAMPYAAIEFLQWGQLTPGLRKGAQAIVKQSMLNVMKKVTLKYGTTLTGEVLEEVAQEIIQVVAEDLSSYFSGKGKHLDPKSMQENIQRVWETTKQATKSMALLPIPGAGIDIYTGQKSIVPATTKITEKPTVPVEVTPITVEKPLVLPVEAKTPAESVRAAIKGKFITEENGPAKIPGPTQWAIKTKDGQIYKSPFGIYTDHSDMATKLGIIPDNIESVGFYFPKENRYSANISEIGLAERGLSPAPEEAKQAEVKQAWETSGLATAPNIADSYVRAEKQPDGKWKLLFRGTKNEVFQGERFNSAGEARQFFKVQRLKAQQATQEARKGFGETNTIFTKDKADIAIARIKENFKTKEGFLTSEKGEQNIEGWKDIITAGGYYFEAGLRAFPEWSAKMISEFGEVIKPRLNNIWVKLNKSKKVQTLIKTEQEPEMAKLRQKIHAIKEVKGLTNKAFNELKRKVTKSGRAVSTTKMSMVELNAMVDKVRKARPSRIGYEKVISPKTERQIKILKDNLTSKSQMTDTEWNNILVRVSGGVEPGYVDAENFVTQTQGREILKQMHNVATVLKITNTFEVARKNKPEIDIEVQRLITELAGEHRDPYSIESMRYYAQQAQLKTGAPLYLLYKALTDTAMESHTTIEAELKAMEAAVGEEEFAVIAGDEVALKRVADYIDSKSNLENKPEMPKDITTSEVKMAQAIEEIFKNREIQARLGKFYRWYEMDMPLTGEGAMADYDRFKREINKAVDIYDTQGEDALGEYLETQTWGIIHSGYDPKELILRKIQLYSVGAKTVGTGHIKVSTAVEFHEQERNILQRLHSYMRQMDILSNLSPLIRAYVQVLEDNADKFDDWQTVKNNTELFLSELKQYGAEKNKFMQFITRLSSQAAQTLLENSITISLYNIFEATALGTDKASLYNPFNRKLTADETAYVETYVMQQRAMLEEFFLVNEPTLPIPGLASLNKLARRIRLTSRSDVVSRYQSFWAKINQVHRALEANTIAEMMSQAKFADFTRIEQITALNILARDGEEAMAMYLAKTQCDNVHARYTRSERAPIEMGVGKVLANLMLFPRMYSERVIRTAYTAFFDPKSNLETRFRASKTLIAVTIGGYLVGMLIAKLTGRKRNPYNPFDIISWKIGGLVFGAIETLSDLYIATLDAFSPDKTVSERALNSLPALIPKVTDMFIPFWAQTIRALEVATDTKYIDRKTLRSIREMFDKDYKKRPSAYKFNKKGIINAAQYILVGRSVDAKENKRRKHGGVNISQTTGR